MWIIRDQWETDLKKNTLSLLRSRSITYNDSALWFCMKWIGCAYNHYINQWWDVIKIFTRGTHISNEIEANFYPTNFTCARILSVAEKRYQSKGENVTYVTSPLVGCDHAQAFNRQQEVMVLVLSPYWPREWWVSFNIKYWCFQGNGYYKGQWSVMAFLSHGCIWLLVWFIGSNVL